MDHSIHFLFLILCSKCIAVNINRIEVPPLVELGTDFVILDCNYSTGVKPGPGLVIKWFFNGSTGLVYQWIPPRQPQVIGLLKGKVDMTFKISEEPLQAYRAIKILRPSTHLSGNYTCVVSTFIEEDRETKSMLVYKRKVQRTGPDLWNQHPQMQDTVQSCIDSMPRRIKALIAAKGGLHQILKRPGKNFHFTQEKNYVFLVTLICAAEDLYPRPLLTILSKGKPLEQAVTDMRMDSWGMYSVETRAEVHDDYVSYPFEEFVCMLSLPLANYTANRTTIYYPGLMPTALIAAIEVEKPQEHQANNCPVRSCAASLILVIGFTHVF